MSYGAVTFWADAQQAALTAFMICLEGAGLLRT